MLTIATPPVYSKLATVGLPEKVQQALPAGISLHEHQLETYQALSDGRYDVVINTAMTGDGKSLAGYLPTLVDGVPLLAHAAVRASHAYFQLHICQERL
jgi:CRISPR-associated endonuclease/helicase Cas3